MTTRGDDPPLNLTIRVAILTARVEALERRVALALDHIADTHTTPGGTP